MERDHGIKYINAANLPKESYCLLCKKVIVDPASCSTCYKTFCKLCLVNYVLKNSRCPSKCDTFNIIIPSIQSHPLLFKTQVTCIKCHKTVSLNDYGSHQLSCSDDVDLTKCWNCNTPVPINSLSCKSHEDYTLAYDYSYYFSLKEDKPFYLQITAGKVNGYACQNGKTLMVTEQRENRSIFCEVVIKGERYLKILRDNKSWRFLGPHYDLGILILKWGKFSGSMLLDPEKKTLISNDGRTKGTFLTMRTSDHKLFFYKVRSDYLSCSIEPIMITSYSDVIDNMPMNSIRTTTEENEAINMNEGK